MDYSNREKYLEITCCIITNFKNDQGHIVSYLANETVCVTIYLIHIIEL